ncbi:cyclin-F-like isoform X1 [Hylobates moloch]|uniref:cyclin-F-like isoform X1 n=1 Tax=Hylobates moloch TaxID=81572 RepID=UPI0026745711|nr:cyclin-F-like isoform X1 [Hylobates moloch]
MGSGGVVHCRCAKCFCYRTKRRIRRRPRNLTILSLPEDVLFHILKWLSVEDVLAVRAVHSQLKDLVDNHASVWACASFQELWPSPGNLKLFERYLCTLRMAQSSPALASLCASLCLTA